MKCVIVESPYAGDVETNVRYARACLRDCLLRGEAPFASHLLYTQDGILDDDDPDERALGIKAGLTIGGHFKKTVVYVDLGMSGGMWQGIKNAEECDREIEIRNLKGWTGWTDKKPTGLNDPAKQSSTVFRKLLERLKTCLGLCAQGSKAP